MSERIQINGFARLDNTSELQKAHKLASNTPLELILELHLSGQLKLGLQILGDFSFLIHDHNKNEFFGARDHFGVIPFYYTFQNGALIYSTKLREIIDHPKVTPQLNEDWIIRHLNNWEEEAHETSYSNIFRLPPGHYLEVKDGKLSSQAYWTLTKPEEIQISREEACKLFRKELSRAVKVRLPEKNEVLATELSAGLDSSSITASALELGANVHAFTHAAESGDDERILIKDFLELHPELKHQLITKTGSNLIEQVIWSTRRLGQVPRAQIAEYSQELLAAASKTSAKVIFSGFGGDECVSHRSTGAAYKEAISHQQWRYLMREAKHARPLAWPYTLAHMLYKYLFQSKPYHFDNSIDQNFLKKEFRLPTFPGLDLPRHKTFDYSKNLLCDRVHTAQRFEESFQIASEFGLEYRYPLMDLQLINLFNSFPLECKFYLNQNRYLFRNETMSDLMPTSIRYNYDKSLGGSVIPGVYDIWHTLDEATKQDIELKFINKDYHAQVKANNKLPFPTYQLLACETMYKEFTGNI